MKDDLSKLKTADYLRKQFGDLSESEIAEISRELGQDLNSIVNDEEVDQRIRKMFVASDQEMPTLSAAVRTKLETARLNAENEQSEGDVYALPKRYQGSEVKKGFVGSRWHTSAVIMGGLAAAAAITIAYVSFVRPVIPKVVVTFAEAITLLTPGPETGFLEPVFTWNSGNGGVVDVKVRAADGSAVAELGNAFSPLRWSSMETKARLESGTEYQLEISGRDGMLETRSFRTAKSAGGAPVPAATLEEIIDQCRSYIGESRPADAWMLWGELTGEQKADPGMQELKAEILAVISG